MKNCLVIVHLWDDGFARSHFDGSVEHHDMIGSANDEPLSLSREEKCALVLRRFLNLKPLIVKYATSKKRQGWKIIDITEHKKANLYIEEETAIADNIYFAGFHADACVLDAMMQLEKKSTLLSNLSDSILHFGISDADHDRIYQKYLEEKFPLEHRRCLYFYRR